MTLLKILAVSAMNIASTAGKGHLLYAKRKGADRFVLESMDLKSKNGYVFNLDELSPSLPDDPGKVEASVRKWLDKHKVEGWTSTGEVENPKFKGKTKIEFDWD